ncbi:MAG: tyrosine-type recombinase/integrase [Zetaproteobacteria bacterium]|nr:tyrosine-type recombinase/integrase [Zetaproteobacteria bacterium]
MHVEYRERRNGTCYYSLSYTDQVTGQRKRISQARTKMLFGGPLTTRREAERAAKTLMPEYESRQQRIQKVTAGQRRSERRQQLLQVYTERQRKVAPNSYQVSVHNLKCYVFVYFFEKRGVQDLSKWANHFEGFRNWLENEATSVRNAKRPLAYRTMNHCVAALNTFLRHAYRRREIRELHLCERFPEHQCGRRGADDVITLPEMEAIVAEFDRAGWRQEATFFKLLYFTGLRFNEALGLSVEDLHEGELDGTLLGDKLATHGLRCYGYLVLRSQPDHATRGLRRKGGEIRRKPLKGQRVMDDKAARVVPITDADLWQRLIHLYNQQVEAYQHQVWGANLDQYALLGDIERNLAGRRLLQVYARLHLKPRSWHCCRHSCATNVLGATGDLMLARMWLGHKSTKVIERYVHVHEQMVRALKKSVTHAGELHKIEAHPQPVSSASSSSGPL